MLENYKVYLRYKLYDIAPLYFITEQCLQIKKRHIRRHTTVVYALQTGDCSDISSTDECWSADRGIAGD